MNQSKLATRFKFESGNAIYKRKNKADFTEWSRNLDPDKIGWQYNSNRGLFYPVVD